MNKFWSKVWAEQVYDNTRMGLDPVGYWEEHRDEVIGKLNKMNKQEIKEKLEFWDEKLAEAEKDKEVAELKIERAEIEIKHLTNKLEK